MFVVDASFYVVGCLVLMVEYVVRVSWEGWDVFESVEVLVEDL